MVSYTKKSLLIILGLTYLSTTQAASSCYDLFSDGKLAKKASAPEKIQSSDIDQQLIDRYDSPNIHALAAYNKLLKKVPSLQNNKNFHSAIRNLLKDESLSTFHLFLTDVLRQVNSQIKSDQTDVALNTFEEALKLNLNKMMSSTEANRRAALIKASPLTAKKLLLALGYMTQKESVEALVGPHGISNISKDSLVGRYLIEAKERGIDVQTSVARFKKGPDYNGRGGEKLYIAVDRRTKALANKFFGNNPHLLAHNHTPGQGTLYMQYLGKQVSYARYNTRGQLAGANGTIVPLIALSSIEASNTNNYFSLGSLNNKFAKYPWGFKKVTEDGKVKDYCRAGGYSSCTHWIGEAPIGQKFVDKYSFPGLFDAYSSARDYETNLGESGTVLRTGSVGEYNIFNSRSNREEIGFTQRDHRLARIVWTQKSGRQQLWQMVGDKNATALSRAEWANPGWVVYSFMTMTTQNRVPVVLLTVTDSSKPLTEEVIDSFTARISQY